jgi:hypothetical protein
MLLKRGVSRDGDDGFFGQNRFVLNYFKKSEGLLESGVSLPSPDSVA